ncbi:MAG: flagellar hook-basal body complex protein FliE [Oscillospiraceae bacterium]|nr:flagellar hook-basal body complex protein FliE [Oscillospiraceae bacterium]
MFIVPLTSSMPSIERLESIGKIDPIVEQKEETPETFGDILKMKIQGVKDLEMHSLQSAYDISTGASSDLESAMLDSAKASTAIEMTTQITTRVVNAYKEIMQMQI